MNNTSSRDDKNLIAELFRLSLAKLGEFNLPVTPLNYALIYFYLSGDDLSFNDELDKLLNNIDAWTEDKANQLFNRYICQSDNNVESIKLREHLLDIVANVLGMLIDLAGKTAISNSSMEKHIDKLSVSKDPKEILQIASLIVTETRTFVEASKELESTLNDSTQEIQSLKFELNNARKLASKDALTGLNNRRAFDQALLDSISSEKLEAEPFCLILLDIDHFKVINDTYGHLIGDKVLVGLSQVLIKNMRGSDYLCRYGGEEFAIIMTDTLITGAFTVAENLRKTIEKLRMRHVKTDQFIDKVSISIGVACYRNGESGSSIIDRCDKALYRAKALGRNRTIIAE